jgi:mannose-6-phosphate isomerase-like protein (cupin superfamily)
MDVRLPELIVKRKEYDYLAPDGSQIRLLITSKQARHASLCHVTLPPEKTSIPVKHQTVEELWCFIAGSGEIWVKNATDEKTYSVTAGSAITIAAGITYQFRNVDKVHALEFIVTTIPEWPGPQEAIFVEGKWQPSVNESHEAVS